MGDTLFVFDHGLMRGAPRKRGKHAASSGWPVVTGIEDMIAHSFMFVESKFESFCIFLSGYDAAWGGTALLGLTQWLVLKKGAKDGNSVHWTFGLAKIVRRRAGKSASEQRLVETARAVLAEFFLYRSRHGVKTLYSDYIEWRGKKRRKDALAASRLSPTNCSNPTRSKRRAV